MPLIMVLRDHEIELATDGTVKDGIARHWPDDVDALLSSGLHL
jgi:hypothetical protein